MVKVEITKEQLKLLSRCVCSPDNMKYGHTKKITQKTFRALNRGYD